MSPDARSPSLVRRLGFQGDERVAVVHVDDIGMCHAANEGGFEALANGPATCGSIMVPCPWFEEAAAMARDRPDCDLGVHLTLNSEWEVYRWGPVAGRDAVPSLCAPDGGMWRSTAETAANARPEEVEIELRAQIEKALAAGIDVTHIDSHMGTVFQAPFLGIYAKLAREFRIPAFAVRPTASQLQNAELPPALQALLDVVQGMEDDGVPVMDGFCADSLSFEPGKGYDHNLGRLRNLGPGVHYLICHAAKGGPELDAMTNEGHCRDFERSFYGGQDGHAALESAGIRTVGMRALRDLMRQSA